MCVCVCVCVCVCAYSLCPHVSLCVLGLSDLQTLQRCTSVVLMVWQPVVVCYITPLKRIFYKPSGLLVLREMQPVAVFSAFLHFLYICWDFHYMKLIEDYFTIL